MTSFLIIWNILLNLVFMSKIAKWFKVYILCIVFFCLFLLILLSFTSILFFKSKELRHGYCLFYNVLIVLLFSLYFANKHVLIDGL